MFILLQVVLCSTAFCSIAECSESVKGSWKDIANISEDNYWSRNAPLWKKGFDEMGPPSIVATYRRSMTSKRAKLRVLFIDRVDDTWVYSPRTASWTKLLEKQIQMEKTVLSRPQHYFRMQPIAIPAKSLCDSRVVLFNGFSVNRNNYLVLSNEAWIFNGVVEKWIFVRMLARVPEGLHGQAAFTFHRNESTCRCKDSMFVYATSKLTGDLDDIWEFRCVDDKNETNMTYEWIRSDQNTISRPKNVSNILFASETVLYWLTNDMSTLRTVDTLTGKNSSSQIKNINCPYHYLTADYNGNFLLDRALHLKKHQIAIFIIPVGLGDVSDSILGVLDLKESLTYCTFTRMCNRGSSDYYQTILLPADDDKVLILGTDAYNGSVVFWSFQIYEILLSAITNSILNAECHGPSYGGHTDDRYPEMLFDHRFMRISDSAWYLMKIWFPSDLQLWLFEVDVLRWSIYDPDEKPETTQLALEAAISATENNCIAYFGSRYGYSSAGHDELWIYATRMRTWTKVGSRGKAPKKLTSYATMSSYENGSLVLFGGVDNQTSSLWIVTVDYERMTATWDKLCCQGDQEKPINQLLRWSSVVWQNNLYIYFGKNTTGDCDSTIYFQNLGNVTEWATKESRSSSYTFCNFDETVTGRFAYTTDEIGNLVMADFNRVEYIIASNQTFLRNSQAVLVSQKSELFSFEAGAVGEVYRSGFKSMYGFDWNAFMFYDSRIRNFRLVGCKPGMFSPQYSVYPCELCPKGQYSEKYNSADCTSCPSGLTTTSTGSTSINNCTCASGTCAHGKCIIQSDSSTLCICFIGYTGKTCDSPTLYLAVMGVTVGLVLVIAFYYILKRVRKHQNVVKYTRVELEMAEQMVEELSNIWSVETDEIEFGRKIGEGSFGDVWTAEYRDQTVAVKVLKIKADDCTNEQLQEFKDESELLRSIFHANIVRLIGTGKTRENKPFIALEYLERGSVRKALDDDYANQPMEIRLQVKYALDAAKGMRHLHRLRRMHRDLKCDNLLIDYKGLVKVADFGCTRIVPKIADDDEDEEESGKIKGSRAVGTALFRAPEIFRGEAYDIGVDVYSYGITLWEIQTAKNPYFEMYERGMTAREILDDIVRKDVRPVFPAKVNGDLKALAISCWNGNPYKRPTFEEIVQTLEKFRYEDEVELLPSRNLDYTVTGDQKEANSS